MTKKLQLKFYNTKTRKIEEFTPIDEELVKMYSCGPTVYSYQHIGNMKAAVFADILRRVIKYAGYNLYSVQNITDVGHLTDDDELGDDGEDKMIKAALPMTNSCPKILRISSGKTRITIKTGREIKQAKMVVC